MSTETATKKHQFTEEEKTAIQQQAVKEGRELGRSNNDIELPKLLPHVEHFYNAINNPQPRLGVFVTDSPIRGAVLSSFLVDGFVPLNTFVKSQLKDFIKENKLSVTEDELFAEIEKEVYTDIVYDNVIVPRADKIVKNIMKKLD